MRQIKKSTGAHEPALLCQVADKERASGRSYLSCPSAVNCAIRRASDETETASVTRSAAEFAQKSQFLRGDLSARETREV